VRVPVERPAQIIIPGAEPIPCRILDVSAHGAKVRPGWKVPLPNGFDLRDIFSGISRAVRVAWRGITAIGVRYEERASDSKKRSDFGKRGLE
jgi:hypothetical protein